MKNQDLQAAGPIDDAKGFHRAFNSGDHEDLHALRRLASTDAVAALEGDLYLLFGPWHP